MKKHIRLIGKIKTPIVSNWSKYRWHYKNKLIKIAISKFNCKDDLIKPYESYAIKKDYGKISRKGRPYQFNCFMGFIHLDFLGDKEDLIELTEIKQLGRYKNEGMGEINWVGWNIFNENKFDEIDINKPKKIKLKKLNLNDIPEKDYKLITACLIHDLVRIEKKHPNKLWGLNDLIINDSDINFIVFNHHTKIKHPLIKRLQKADQKASIISRQKERKIKAYTYNPIRKGYEDLIDLQTTHTIKEGIETRLDNFTELYDYIWNCKELDFFVESQNYPNSSLKKHLLLTAQFAVG